MRRLLMILAMIALLLGAGWLGGEALLARELRRFAAEEPSITLGAVRELRRPVRIGVALSDIELATVAGILRLPQAGIWASPLKPTLVRLDLPETGSIDFGQGALPLGFSAPKASLRLRPLDGFGMGAASLGSGPVTLDGRPLAGSVALDAVLVPLGDGPPRDAAVAYAVTAELGEIDAKALRIPLPGPASLALRGQVWLDRMPGPDTLAPETAPQPVRLRLDDSELVLGGIRARIVGQIEADAQGRAEGVLAIYTTDARPILQAAADAGLIPNSAVRLGGALLGGLSAIPLPQDAPVSFPEPAPGEIRLPLTFSDGRASLGQLPLGPAPRFPTR